MSQHKPLGRKIKLNKKHVIAVIVVAIGLFAGFGYYYLNTRTSEVDRHYFKFLKMFRDTTRNCTEQDTLKEFCITPNEDSCDINDSIQRLLQNDEKIDLKQIEDK